MLIAAVAFGLAVAEASTLSQVQAVYAVVVGVVSTELPSGLLLGPAGEIVAQSTELFLALAELIDVSQEFAALAGMISGSVLLVEKYREGP